MRNSSYFAVTRIARSEAEMDHWMRSGDVLFGVEIPAGFERGVRRGDRPALLVAADASDPVAAGTALAALEGVVQNAFARDRGLPETIQSVPAFEIRQHRRYNPAAVTSLNIVPGLLGTILTMTMLIFTALSVTREIERGTMESLLAMPIRPIEIMLGKIAPYILIGFLQAALIMLFAVLLFHVPVEGSVLLLAALSTLFIATNLSIGYTFSTIAQNQLQAIQMSFMFFLPNILLSGFMFPYAGMPGWAQAVGEMLPLTHYIRIARGVMLKGANPVRSAHRGAGTGGPDAARHDAGRTPLPHHAGLTRARLAVIATELTTGRRVSPDGLPHLVGVDVEAGELGHAEAGGERHVGGVAAVRHQDAADARSVVACIERVPAPAEVHLEPGAEIHRVRHRGDADVAEIAGAVARRDVHAAAQRDGEVGEVPAHAALLAKAVPGGAGGRGVLIAEVQALVNVVADRLHPPPAGRSVAEHRPGHAGEVVGVAVAAAQQIDEDIVGQVLDGNLLRVRRERCRGCRDRR